MNVALIPGILISVLTLACILILLRGLKKVLPMTGWDKKKQNNFFIRTVLIIFIWMILLTVLSLTGFFSDFSKLPPRPALAIIVPLPFIVLLTFSKSFTQLLKVIPPGWLIFFQVFRIAVEVILFAGYLNTLLPEQMTFGGRNFDLISGLLALPVGYYCFVKKRWPKSIALVFNIAGLLLLLNVLIIAVLSMPTSMRYFMNEPSVKILAEFPFIYLPGVLVVLAYSFHIFSLRQLLSGKINATPA